MGCEKSILKYFFHSPFWGTIPLFIFDIWNISWHFKIFVFNIVYKFFNKFIDFISEWRYTWSFSFFVNYRSSIKRYKINISNMFYFSFNSCCIDNLSCCCINNIYFTNHFKSIYSVVFSFISKFSYTKTM